MRKVGGRCARRAKRTREQEEGVEGGRGRAGRRALSPASRVRPRLHGKADQKSHDKARSNAAMRFIAAASARRAPYARGVVWVGGGLYRAEGARKGHSTRFARQVGRPAHLVGLVVTSLRSDEGTVAVMPLVDPRACWGSNAESDRIATIDADTLVEMPTPGASDRGEAAPVTAAMLHE